MSKEVKQVIVVNKSLNMRKGKIGSQSAHAAFAFVSIPIRESLEEITKGLKHVTLKLTVEEVIWFLTGTAKIVCQAESERQMMEIFGSAKRAGLTVHEVIDAGGTEFKGVPTRTAICIGPNFSENIDKITGHLPLY